MSFWGAYGFQNPNRGFIMDLIIFHDFVIIIVFFILGFVLSIIFFLIFSKFSSNEYLEVQRLEVL